LRRRTKLSILAIGLLLLVATASYRMLRSEPNSGYLVSAHFPDITGIAPRSGVEMAGRRVGVVESIWLEEGDARIDIRMVPSVKLYEDAAIGKRAGCTGDPEKNCVLLLPGTVGKPTIQDGGSIDNLIGTPGR